MALFHNFGNMHLRYPLANVFVHQCVMSSNLLTACIIGLWHFISYIYISYAL